MENEACGERYDWIDIARCFAIFCVVLNHSIENIYDLSVGKFTDLSIGSQVFAFVAYTFGRMGVPVFLMITGYLLIDRDWTQKKCLKFWKRNWGGLLVCTEIWWVIYDVLLSVYYNIPINILSLVEDMLFVRKIDLAHTWYMPMILGMYILIPMVGMALQKFDIKYLLFPIIVFSAYSFGYPFLNMVSSILGMPLSLQFSLGFSGGVYGLYIIYGYLIKKGTFKKIPKYIASLIGMIFFVLTVKMQVYAHKIGLNCNVWYDSVLLMICAVTMMVLFSKILPRIELSIKVRHIIRNLSKNSFGIYLFHMLVLYFLKPFMLSNSWKYGVKFWVLMIAVFSISWICVEIFSKIPKVGKILFNIR